MNKKHLGDNYAPAHTSTPFKQHLSGVGMELLTRYTVVTLQKSCGRYLPRV